MTSLIEESEPEPHTHIYTLGNVSQKKISIKQGWQLHFLWICECGGTLKSISKFFVNVPREGTK